MPKEKTTHRRSEQTQNMLVKVKYYEMIGEN